MAAPAAGICRLDGTMTPLPPQTAQPGAAVNVATMSLDDRFREVLRRTAPLLPGEIQEEFQAMLSPTALLIMAGTLAVWAGSHYFGVGFVVDALMLAGGAIFLGYQVISAGMDFCNAISLTASAKTSQDLDAAAALLANFVATVGVAVFSALLMKGAKAAAPSARAGIAGLAAAKYGGMTPAHYRIFQQVARLQNRIIAVRNTNPLSTKWIELGYPGKPITIKAHTSKTTGIVTTANAAEKQAARTFNYYVVDADGIARNASGQALKLPARTDWPLETGQVIDGRSLKPLVGDYDLLGVIDPTARGRNIVLATDRGETLLNWSGPENERVATAVNQMMDQPRVLHGAHDGFADVGSAGPSTVFFPDGFVLDLPTPEAVAQFYRSIGRQPIIKPKAP